LIRRAQRDRLPQGELRHYIVTDEDARLQVGFRIDRDRDTAGLQCVKTPGLDRVHHSIEGRDQLHLVAGLDDQIDLSPGLFHTGGGLFQDPVGTVQRRLSRHAAGKERGLPVRILARAG
jgi:hypothetical protein